MTDVTDFLLENKASMISETKQKILFRPSTLSGDDCYSVIGMFTDLSHENVRLIVIVRQQAHEKDHYSRRKKKNHPHLQHKSTHKSTVFDIRLKSRTMGEKGLIGAVCLLSYLGHCCITTKSSTRKGIEKSSCFKRSGVGEKAQGITSTSWRNLLILVHFKYRNI